MKPAADQEESKTKIDGGTTSAKSGAAFLGFAYDLLRVEPRDRDVESARSPSKPSLHSHRSLNKPPLQSYRSLNRLPLQNHRSPDKLLL